MTSLDDAKEKGVQYLNEMLLMHSICANTIIVDSKKIVDRLNSSQSDFHLDNMSERKQIPIKVPWETFNPFGDELV